MAVPTNFMEGGENYGAAIAVRKIRRLFHLLLHHFDPVWIGFHQSAPGCIVTPVDRAFVVAVEVRTITRESNEVSHLSAR